MAKEQLFLNCGFFSKAYQATKKQIGISLVILLFVTVVLSVCMWLAESRANSDFTFFDALTWSIVKYVEDPAEITDAPVTLIGKIIGTLVGIIGVAIFAVPAGLIGSGMLDAMEEEKRDEELASSRRRMKKAFRRSGNKGLREYLTSLSDGGGAAFKTLNFVPQRVPIAKMQVRQGMDMKDIIDTCNKFEEFRLKNLADAKSDEDEAEDRFVVEHFPLNRKYGCCIPRDSKVTIVCTSSFDEVDSFYNLSSEPLYDKKSLSTYDEKKDKEAVNVLKKKLENRNEFLDDINRFAQEGSWLIVFTEHLKTKDNQMDFHFADCLKDDSASTVSDQDAYQLLFHHFAEGLKSEFALESAFRSPRYPLLKKNLGYTIRKSHPNSNVFVLRPSSELVNFNDRKLAIAYRMAAIISQQLDGGRGIQEKDVLDFKETGFGYNQ